MNESLTLGREFRVQDRTVSELQLPLLRAVVLSMELTGKWVARDGTVFYSHDDYDDAMAALFELSRRAKEVPCG